jgi:hypothetical protein
MARAHEAPAQRDQLTERPFVKLNVELVRNGGASRY